MHIPDGMLDTKTFTTLWAGGGGAVAYASWWIRKHLDSSKLVLMSVLAALIFGLQMLNFPIAAGTSGHFSGGAAAGIILGFWPATLVMSAVLITQAFFFGDGGISTLGANIVNLGVVGPCLAVLVYQLGCRFSRRFSTSLAVQLVVTFLAAFLAVVSSAAVVALELWASNRVPLLTGLVAMVGWHSLIGIGEGIITAGLVAYLVKVRPSLLPGQTADSKQEPSGSLRSVIVVFAILALAAAGLSFLASSSPDGLEFVYFDSGLGSDFHEPSSLIPALMSDYQLPWVSNELLSGIAAGVIGVFISGALLFTVATLIVRRQRAQS